MFKIGDFSKICQVTRQTLRHWDKINLLKPAHVDDHNRYRYYTVDQIADVNRILSLQLLGFTLNEIQEILTESYGETLSEEKLRAKFEDKIRHVNQMIDQFYFQRELLEVRLRNMSSDRPFTQEISLKSPEPMLVYTYRKSFADIVALSAAILDVYQYQETGKQHALTISHVTAIEEKDLDVEVGFIAVKSDISDEAQQAFDLQKCQICDTESTVSTIFHGSWLQGVDVYNEIGRWLDANGYMLSGPWREIYHRIDPSSPAGKQSVTECQFPVSRLDHTIIGQNN